MGLGVKKRLPKTGVIDRYACFMRCAKSG